MAAAGEFLAKNGLKTFVCSETQKFGHVTFFWNGNRSGYFDEKLETYLEVSRWVTNSRVTVATVLAVASCNLFYVVLCLTALIMNILKCPKTCMTVVSGAHADSLRHSALQRGPAHEGPRDL